MEDILRRENALFTRLHATCMLTKHGPPRFGNKCGGTVVLC
jgi:hypothetical protein